MEERKIKELSERLFNLLDPWDRVDTSIEEQEQILRENPLAAVEYLLDLVENQ